MTRINDSEENLEDYFSKLIGGGGTVRIYDFSQSVGEINREFARNGLLVTRINDSEMKLALGPIAKGGAGGGIAAVLHALYDAEIMTSHELVDQITHLESLIAQADLVIFGEGVSEEDRLLETTTIRIAELATKHHKPSIAICAT